MADATKAKKATVTWAAVHGFEERVMRPIDWARVGGGTPDAEQMAMPDTVWNQSNGWTVNRASVPLDDDQLAAFLVREPKFSLREE